MTYSTEHLGKTVTVTVDRPLGSKHPKHNYWYSVNYGFVDGTIAPDGGGVDAYVLGVFKPVDTFVSKVIAVIHRTDDDDDKLVVVPEGNTYSDEAIMAIVHFQERFFKSVIIRE